MIDICNINKKFANSTVLENFSYRIDNSSICGLIGYNGAGKTTLLKIIAGIYKPEKGEVLIDGENIYENENLKKYLFIVEDEPYFLSQGTIYSMSKFYKGYYPCWSDTTCAKLCNIFNLDPNKKINGFSKGMQRQAALILGLSCRPYYLLLDESFDGLDLSKRNLVKDILLEYIKQRGKNILISSHNLPEVEDICNHICIIKDKKLSYATSVEEMRKKHIKYSVIFANQSDIELLRKANIKNFTQKGHNVTFIYNGNSKDVYELLKPLDIIHTEILSMTLDEIFLEESGEKTYDLKGLF